MRNRTYLPMGPHRPPAKSPALHEDRGIRHLKIAVGGAFKISCLATLQEAEAMALDDLVQVVFVDTDASGVEHLPQRVKLILNDLRAADLLEAIEMFKERFPGWEILGDLVKKWEALGAAEALPAGLMTRRELGALVLVYTLWRNPALMRNFLLSSARDLHKAAANDCWKLNSAALKKHRLVVSYFFSSCGGTGSSLSLLLADLQRHLLSTDGGFTSVEFVAHILLPGPMLHRAVDAEAIKANTWAFFLELMQRYRDKLQPLQLASIWVPRRHRPFMHVYLYDENNQREQIFTSREQINEVVKEIEKLMTLGLEGQEYQARGVDYHLAFPNIFSSAGCWILVYPYQEIEEAFALRSGADWIGNQPLKALDPNGAKTLVNQRVKDFLTQNPGLRDLPALDRDAANRRLRVNLDPVKNLPRKRLAGSIDDISVRQIEEIGETLGTLAGQVQGELAVAIRDEVEALLNQPGGVELAGRFLRQILILLQEHKQGLDDEIDDTRTSQKRRREQLEAVRNPGFWRRYSFNHRSAHLKQAQRTNDSSVKMLQARARLALVNQLIQTTQKLQAECSSWGETLIKLQERLGKSLEDHWRSAEANRPLVEEWVVCRDEIAAMYEEQAAEVLTQAAEQLHLGWDAEDENLTLRYHSTESSSVARWHTLSATGLEQHTKHFRRFWANRVDRSVEEILAERGDSPEQVLAYLEHRGAPLIKVDDTTQIPAEKTLKILGSQTQSYWDSMVGQTGLSVVGTGNRHRVSLLSTVHGINPMSGLMQSKAWKQAYDDAVTSGRSPHVFPDVEIDLDQTPGNDAVSGTDSGAEEREEDKVEGEEQEEEEDDDEPTS